MRLLLLIGVVTLHAATSNAMALEPTNYEALEAVTRSANTFSPNFFKAVASDKTGNLICSPISASMVLSMAAYGARGNTEKQFRSALALPKNDALAQSGFQSFVDSFKNYKQVELRLANKMFLANNFVPKTEFKAVTETAFRSEAESLNFGKAVEASKTINDWCEAQTNNRIKDLIKPDDLSSNTALVLVNAVYFKGNWANKFDINDTKDKPFHVNGLSATKDVPTMYRYGSYNYGELPEVNAKFIELPYKSDGFNDSISMFIILPDEVNGLAELEKNIEKVTVDKLLRGSPRDCHVYLPKFKIESELPLEKALGKMGMTDMFTDAANFTGIVDAPPLKVSKVIQKAFIEVNEEGSEAAAATGLGIMLLSIDFDALPPVNFNVDRPAHFIIATQSRQQGVTLFRGSIQNPGVKITMRCMTYPVEMKVDRPFIYSIIAKRKSEDRMNSGHELFVGIVAKPQI